MIWTGWLVLGIVIGAVAMHAIDRFVVRRVLRGHEANARARRLQR